MPRNLKSSTLLLLALGAFVVLAGLAALRQWTYLGGATRTAYSISLAAGLVACACAIWMLAGGRRRRALGWTAAGAGLVLAVNQGLGLWFGTLLCYTPG
jgi:uncharacterized membrane protein